ncbi:MAG: hypothetical protein HN979_00895 [Actinobacteria bacterium]|jgi:hypothetical protein|nr:hypothetical protein [Actinomycetota bacterium]MBT3687581.1 hypothetical protein [Actinomycetota bacterium]MBT4036781.1 hypothetical protein [Actinomycetota bacterium]MBT4278832.1 hypothetical protein [Actinomycetota bacterium]MBT4343226.1 hypothetical protein [Actinomycetota bacterium]
MARGDSRSKVARAAKAGSSGGSGEPRRYGFPAAVTIVVVLGVLLVGWARENREATSAPRVGDHWHSIYDIYVCNAPDAGTWRAKVLNENDPNGIHTHGDGLIHIHPFNSLASGDDATMGEFFSSFGAIDDTSITLDTGEVITEGFDCGGQPAVLKVARYDTQDRDRDPEVFTEGLADIRFMKDLEAFTIAFLPADEVPPISRPERFTFLESVDPRAIESEVPFVDAPAEADNTEEAPTTSTDG